MSNAWDGLLIKAIDNDRVYLIASGMKRWIMNMAVFTALGYKVSQIITISQNEVDGFPSGPDITSASPGGNDMAEQLLYNQLSIGDWNWYKVWGTPGDPSTYRVVLIPHTKAEYEAAGITPAAVQSYMQSQGQFTATQIAAAMAFATFSGPNPNPNPNPTPTPTPGDFWDVPGIGPVRKEVVLAAAGLLLIGMITLAGGEK